MSSIVVKGGHVITPTEERFTDVVIVDGMITAIGGHADQPNDAEIIDATDCYVTPGLIDLQVNGTASCNLWADPSVSQMSTFATELSKAGVTTILPTLITDDLDHLRKNIDFLEKEVGVGAHQLEPASSAAAKESTPAAATGSKSGGTAALKQRTLPVRMPGIHLEGPCLSPERPGVHPKQHLQPLTMDVVQRLVSDAVKLVTLAPELDSSGKCVQHLRSKGIEVALGHSNATYEEAESAFNNDVRMVTHTYNAMPAVHHRSPGAVVAALLDNRVMCCLICDGQHVSPPAAQLVFRAKGIGRTILVTDVAHVGTSQGGLVGSSILLDEAVRNVVKWGIASFAEAIAMSTLNPARSMGWDGKIGHLAPGKLADLVIWDQQLKVRQVIAAGRKL